jgi:DNA-binding transcriptional MerR regulator
LDKAAEAFRNIGEVSVELGVRKHVLRFWELKFPQLKPMKRGGGRRLYRPADVELLRGIQHLLQNAGYTIKGVQRILRERGVDTVKMSVGAGVRAAGSGKARSAASAAAGEGSVLLSSHEIDALRSVVAELDSCRLLLSHDNGSGSGQHYAQAAKR